LDCAEGRLGRPALPVEFHPRFVLQSIHLTSAAKAAPIPVSRCSAEALLRAKTITREAPSILPLLCFLF
jgi:hypothetical protein